MASITMEFPGVEYTEKEWDSSNAIAGVDVSICGMMIKAQKGPINTLTHCTSIDQAKAIFGNYIQDAYGMYAVDGFFKNGGSDLYIVRLAHYSDISNANTLTATKASGSLNIPADNTKASEPTLLFTDKYHGSLGNLHGIKIIDEPRVKTSMLDDVALDETTSLPSIPDSEGDESTQSVSEPTVVKTKNEITVKVVKDFVIGEYVKIFDDTDTEYKMITAIDIPNRILTLESGLSKAFLKGSTVQTADFTLETYTKSIFGDNLEKTFKGVNMDVTSSNYVINVVNSKSRGTSLLELEDAYLEVDFPYLKNPAPTDKPVYMTGGNDGLEGFSDIDIIGDANSKTGLYAFDEFDDMIHVCCPETTSKAVITAGFDYWEKKMTGMFFAYTPSGLLPEEAADFRDEGGWNTSYGALYYNWGYVTDPIGIGDNPEKLIPLTGHVLGAMCKNDNVSEDSYGSAPAGESVTLKGVNRLEFKVDKKNGGILYGNNNRNINPIVSLKGNGITVWGSRTQSAKPKWMQIKTRRIFIYVELSIVNGSRWMAFKNKTDKLYREVNRVVRKFLSGVKGLYGETDEEKYEFICDSTINDPDDPYVIGRVGLKPSGVAEFIFFEFGQKPEGISLSEV